MSSSQPRFPRTPAEREFRRKYWQLTGFEFQDDTREPFIDRANSQMRWYEAHTTETRLQLDRLLSPWRLKELEKEIA